MLNEDKIKLMTNISMFEKKEGKNIFPVNRYFKGDYVSAHMWRSFLGYTFCWILGTIIWVLYNIESLLGNAITDNPGSLLMRYGVLYGIGLIIYLVITMIVYSRRYHYASRGLKVYVAKLKRLEKRYDMQNKTKELVKGGRQT